MTNPLHKLAMQSAVMSALSTHAVREFTHDEMVEEKNRQAKLESSKPKEKESTNPTGLLNNSIIYKPSKMVETIDDNLFLLLNTMLEVLNKSKNGVGLAANQIADDRRVIIVKTPNMFEAMINPIIRGGFGEVMSTESCLSFPGLVAKVPRLKQVEVQWLATDRTIKNRKFRNLEAMVIQHEIDHLNGKTIEQYATQRSL